MNIFILSTLLFLILFSSVKPTNDCDTVDTGSISYYQDNKNILELENINALSCICEQVEKFKYKFMGIQKNFIDLNDCGAVRYFGKVRN